MSTGPLQLAGGRPRTAQELAYDALRRAILRGDLQEGTRLQQSTLAKQLQVSTTPVREALGRLASDGLVRIDPHRGALVRGLNDEELEEIYELRQILEPIAARKAAERITAEELDRAEHYWSLMNDHSDATEWAENNRQFHAVIAEAAKAPYLTSILTGLRDSSTRYVQWSLSVDPQRFVAANQDHRDLLDACRAGNGERAAVIETRHLNATLNLLRIRQQRAADTAPSPSS